MIAEERLAGARPKDWPADQPYLVVRVGAQVLFEVKGRLHVSNPAMAPNVDLPLAPGARHLLVTAASTGMGDAFGPHMGTVARITQVFPALLHRWIAEDRLYLDLPGRHWLDPGLAETVCRLTYYAKSVGREPEVLRSLALALSDVAITLGASDDVEHRAKCLRVNAAPLWEVHALLAWQRLVDIAATGGEKLTRLVRAHVNDLFALAADLLRIDRPAEKLDAAFADIAERARAAASPRTGRPADDEGRVRVADTVAHFREGLECLYVRGRGYDLPAARRALGEAAAGLRRRHPGLDRLSVTDGRDHVSVALKKGESPLIVAQNAAARALRLSFGTVESEWRKHFTPRLRHQGLDRFRDQLVSGFSQPAAS